MQQLLKHWKLHPKGKSSKDYMDFLQVALDVTENNQTLLSAQYKLLEEHLRDMEHVDGYVEKYMEFLYKRLESQQFQMQTLEFLVNFLPVLERSKLSLRMMQKIAQMSRMVLEKSDFQALNVIWKSILKIITRDISQELKYYLFKNAFMEQIAILLENKDLDSKKYYGLIAFYLGHLNAFVKFSTIVIVGEEDMIIGFLVSTGESVFQSLDLKVENAKFESLLVGLQCIVSCVLQQPVLQDSQKVLLVNKIIQGEIKSTHVFKSKMYLISFVWKAFDKLDVNAQAELIKPKSKGLIGILDFVLKGVSEIPMKELKTQIWSRNSLYDQLLVCFGVMVHGLHGYSMKMVIQNLIENLIGKTTPDLETLILDLLQILVEIDERKVIAATLTNDLMFLLESISTKSNSFQKLYKVIDRMGITTFQASWMMYPSWKNITDSELNCCLLLWASPLCSLSATEYVIKHLESIQKVWKVVCSEMDQTNDPAFVSKRYHVLGLIIDCDISIFNSKHMSENGVRKLMASISREISTLIPPLITGGFQILLSTLNLSFEDTKFIAATLESIFRLIPFIIHDIQPSAITKILEVCIKWADNSRLNSYLPQREVFALLEALMSRTPVEPDKVAFVVGKISEYCLDLSEHDLSSIYPNLFKILPNFSLCRSPRNIREMDHENQRLVSLTCLKRSIPADAVVDLDKPISQITFMLANPQSKKALKEKDNELRYLKTAISACQYRS